MVNASPGQRRTANENLPPRAHFPDLIHIQNPWTREGGDVSLPKLAKILARILLVLKDGRVCFGQMVDE